MKLEKRTALYKEDNNCATQEWSQSSVHGKQNYQRPGVEKLSVGATSVGPTVSVDYFAQGFGGFTGGGGS